MQQKTKKQKKEKTEILPTMLFFKSRLGKFSQEELNYIFSTIYKCAVLIDYDKNQVSIWDSYATFIDCFNFDNSLQYALTVTMRHIESGLIETGEKNIKDQLKNLIS